MSGRVLYVYGVGPATLDVRAAPPGLDGSAVHLHPHGRFAALCSAVDARTYAAGEIESRVGDVEWVSPRAMQHDAVLTWATEAGGVVPFPMFTLFSGPDALSATLSDRAATLARVLARVESAQEFTVRVRSMAGEIEAALRERSEELADLESQALSATPGTRYLLEKKIAAVRRATSQRAGEDVAGQVRRALEPRAVASVTSPLVPTRTAQSAGEATTNGTLVLDSSFLVRREAVDAFRDAVRAVAAGPALVGFRVELSGPWPPYHFASESA